MPGPTLLPQLLSMDQLADRFGVTRRHVRRLVDERRVPFLRVGRFIRLTPNRSLRGSTPTVCQLVPRRTSAAQIAGQYCHEETSPPPSLQVDGPDDRTEERGGHQ